MPKPFGKPAHARLGLTPAARLLIALWGAALPAYVISSLAAGRYPPLSGDPFFWPSAFGFIGLETFLIVRWLRARPSPRGPWESGRRALLVGRILLALLVATPAGLATAFLYEPTFELANGMLSFGAAQQEYAMVAHPDPPVALDLLYAHPPFRINLSDPRFQQERLGAGSLATITLRRGLLGARWIEKVEYEVLR
jgi:hypothetical protein